MKTLMILEPPFADDDRVRREARALVAAGHEVAVLNPGPGPDSELDGALLLHEPGPGSRFAIGARINNLAAALGFVDPWWRRAIKRALARFPAELIHVHDLPLVRTGTLAARSCGAQVIADLHENTPYLMQLIVDTTRWPYSQLHNLRRWQDYEGAALAQVDAVICVIEEARERLENEAKVPLAKISVVANYVDPPADPGAAPPHSGPLILGYVGVMNGHRGLSFAIGALPELRERLGDVRLRLAGEGPERGALEAQVAALGLGESVEFPGWVPLDAMPEAFAAADIGLVIHEKNPLTQATIPNKLFGLMAARRPVLVSDCRPLERIVNDAGCGRVVPWANREAFFGAVAELANPVERARLGAAGRAAVEEKYGWPRAADALVRLYGRLAGSPRGDS